MTIDDDSLPQGDTSVDVVSVMIPTCRVLWVLDLFVVTSYPRGYQCRCGKCICDKSQQKVAYVGF